MSIWSRNHAELADLARTLHNRNAETRKNISKRMTAIGSLSSQSSQLAATNPLDPRKSKSESSLSLISDSSDNPRLKNNQIYRADRMHLQVDAFVGGDEYDDQSLTSTTLRSRIDSFSSVDSAISPDFHRSPPSPILKNSRNRLSSSMPVSWKTKTSKLSEKKVTFFLHDDQGSNEINSDAHENHLLSNGEVDFQMNAAGNVNEKDLSIEGDDSFLNGDCSVEEHSVAINGDTFMINVTNKNCEPTMIHIKDDITVFKDIDGHSIQNTSYSSNGNCAMECDEEYGSCNHKDIDFSCPKDDSLSSTTHHNNVGISSPPSPKIVYSGAASNRNNDDLKSHLDSHNSVSLLKITENNIKTLHDETISQSSIQNNQAIDLNASMTFTNHTGSGTMDMDRIRTNLNNCQHDELYSNTENKVNVEDEDEEEDGENEEEENEHKGNGDVEEEIESIPTLRSNLNLSNELNLLLISILANHRQEQLASSQKNDDREGDGDDISLNDLVTSQPHQPIFSQSDDVPVVPSKPQNNRHVRNFADGSSQDIESTENDNIMPSINVDKVTSSSQDIVSINTCVTCHPTACDTLASQFDATKIPFTETDIVKTVSETILCLYQPTNGNFESETTIPHRKENMEQLQSYFIPSIATEIDSETLLKSKPEVPDLISTGTWCSSPNVMNEVTNGCKINTSGQYTFAGQSPSTFVYSHLYNQPQSQLIISNSYHHSHSQDVVVAREIASQDVEKRFANFTNQQSGILMPGSYFTPILTPICLSSRSTTDQPVASLEMNYLDDEDRHSITENPISVSSVEKDIVSYISDSYTESSDSRPDYSDIVPCETETQTTSGIDNFEQSVHIDDRLVFRCDSETQTQLNCDLVETSNFSEKEHKQRRVLPTTTSQIIDGLANSARRKIWKLVSDSPASSSIEISTEFPPSNNTASSSSLLEDTITSNDDGQEIASKEYDGCRELKSKCKASELLVDNYDAHSKDILPNDASIESIVEQILSVTTTNNNSIPSVVVSLQDSQSEKNIDSTPNFTINYENNADILSENLVTPRQESSASESNMPIKCPVNTDTYLQSENEDTLYRDESIELNFRSEVLHSNFSSGSFMCSEDATYQSSNSSINSTVVIKSREDQERSKFTPLPHRVNKRDHSHSSRDSTSRRPPDASIDGARKMNSANRNGGRNPRRNRTELRLNETTCYDTDDSTITYSQESHNNALDNYGGGSIENILLNRNFSPRDQLSKHIDNISWILSGQINSSTQNSPSDYGSSCPKRKYKRKKKVRKSDQVPINFDFYPEQLETFVESRSEVTITSSYNNTEMVSDTDEMAILFRKLVKCISRTSSKNVDELKHQIKLSKQVFNDLQKQVVKAFPGTHFVEKLPSQNLKTVKDTLHQLLCLLKQQRQNNKRNVRKDIHDRCKLFHRLLIPEDNICNNSNNLKEDLRSRMKMYTLNSKDSLLSIMHRKAEDKDQPMLGTIESTSEDTLCSSKSSSRISVLPFTEEEIVRRNKIPLFSGDQNLNLKKTPSRLDSSFVEHFLDKLLKSRGADALRNRSDVLHYLVKEWQFAQANGHNGHNCKNGTFNPVEKTAKISPNGTFGKNRNPFHRMIQFMAETFDSPVFDSPKRRRDSAIDFSTSRSRLLTDDVSNPMPCDGIDTRLSNEKLSITTCTNAKENVLTVRIIA